MKHQISQEVRLILRDLDDLCAAARRLLYVASPSAQEEWKKLESLLPLKGDVQSGMILLSKADLVLMTLKVRRFRDILAPLADLGP